MESSFQIFPLTSKVWSPKTNYGCLPLPDSVNWLADKVARLAATIFTVPLDLISAPIRGVRHVYCPRTSHAPIFPSPFDQRLRPSGNGQPPNLSSPKATQQPPSVPVGDPPKSSTPSSSAPLKPSITSQSNPPLDLPPPPFPAPFVNSSAPIGQNTPAAVQPSASLVAPPPPPIPSYYPMATPLSPSYVPTPPQSQVTSGYPFSSPPIPSQYPIAAPLYPSHAPTPPSQVKSAYPFSPAPSSSPYPIAAFPHPSASSFSSASTSPAMPTSIAVFGSTQNQSVSYPIRQALANLGPQDLLKLLNPDFNPANVENRREMNVWLGFSEDYQIMPKDLEVLQKKIAYADLTPERKREARRAFYEGLRSLLKEGQWIELPFKDSYGNRIKIGLVKNPWEQQPSIQLFFFTKERLDAYKFSIQQDGQSIYMEYYSDSMDATPAREIKVEGFEEYIFQQLELPLNEKDFKKRFNACFNLTIQNYERIRTALSQPSEKNKRALHLFQNCASLLTTFARGEHPLQRPQDSQVVARTSKTQEGTTTIIYGPFWNPVTSASDSQFTWEIQQLGSGLSFSSKKQSGGRSFHSTGERSVTLSTTGSSNELKVTVMRENSWEGSTDRVTSEYRCFFTSDGCLVIKGLNKNEKCQEFALFMGMSDINTSENSKPILSDQQTDAQFVSEALENLAELSSSPHTLFIPSDLDEPCRTLQGVIVPMDRLTHFVDHCQNSRGALPMFLTGKSNKWKRKKKLEGNLSLNV